MKDTIYRADAIEELCTMMVDCFDADEEVIDAIITTMNEISSVEPTPEEVWNVAQKVFYSTLTYREAVDYLKEVEKQHKLFLNGKRKNEYGKERI